MEWMLQVIDELDDALSTARQYCLGLIAEIGLLQAPQIDSRRPLQEFV
jgi:hypothetical protein